MTKIQPIKKLLVANRGEIARRVFRTARAMDIATVSVFSDADERAPHVAEADESVRLTGHSPAETYLNVQAILAAARLTHANAIHPGYGFLSENAGFARACAEVDITFVGPTPEAIDAMGSKIAAKDLMSKVGVPVLPGVTVRTGDDLQAAAAVTGWPVLVKAAFGGGGRGMRVVRTPEELTESVASAQREAEAAFGDNTVFLERFVEDPRHIEVQVFGDTHGTVVHLFERECSIQRRYQKIIEEAPSPAVDDALRAELCGAAVTAAQALNYVGAGTVEFVVDQHGAFFFLEVNTRLQVEHPVTEMVTGLDLVELQLRIANGEPLPAAAVNARLNGHSVEARLYAEDVTAGFIPASGRIERLSVPTLPGIRVDSGYETGSTVSTHYDAMLAKVISWAPTREKATTILAEAIKTSHIHGPPTNRELLVRVLRHPEFVAGRIDTGFLTRYDCAQPLASDSDRQVYAAAAALARQAVRRSATATLSGLPSGWRNVPTVMQRAEYESGVAHSGDHLSVGYRFNRHGIEVEVGGQPLDVKLWSATPEVVDFTVGGVRRTVHIHRVGNTVNSGIVYIDDAAGSSTLREIERFPLPDRAVAAGAMLAPMPGSVVSINGKLGDRVEVGAVLVVIEAMKMEHRIASPIAGTIGAFMVIVGAQVDTGTVLAVVEDHEHDHERKVVDGH